MVVLVVSLHINEVDSLYHEVDSLIQFKLLSGLEWKCWITADYQDEEIIYGIL